MPVSPARLAAFEILLRVETTDSYSSELLHSPRFAKLSSPDHGLMTELVMGVLRWRSVLDKHIDRYLSQAPGKLDREVLATLRLGAYQLLFLDRIPSHAAINESVELVKQARKRSAAGMVNAVLRKISKSQLNQKQGNFSSAFRAGAGQRNLEESHPLWMVERWRLTYGAEAAGKVCEYDQTPPQTTVRLTPNSRDFPFRAEGVRLERGQLVTKAAIVTAGDVTRTPEFRERRLIIQDEASQLVALLAGHGKLILDCCAAPGGKTRILAERNPESQVIAMDLHPHRTRLLRRLVAESNVQVIAADGRQMPFATKFDRILVDAPCSGTGTLARNPEIKWRLMPEDLARLQEYQLQILEAAMKQVAPGGRIVYSTCSLEPDENSRVVERALATDSSFRIVDCRVILEELLRDGELAWRDIRSLLSGPFLRTIPGVHACDGFFAAILEKT